MICVMFGPPGSGTGNATEGAAGTPLGREVL